MTNELYNIDISKIKKNPNMKPRKNPIHHNFVDDLAKVFTKFNMKEVSKLNTGGNNKIYKNEDFVVRISRLTLQPEDASFCRENHFDKMDKQRDEEMLTKAMKYNLSPRVYLISNISIDGNIHRYYVMESYTICLKRFITRRTVVNILKIPCCVYINSEEIYEDMAKQIYELCQKINEMGVVYYDFKADNILANVNNETGKVTLNMTDWDSEFCVEEPYLDGNEDVILFLNMCICGYYLYYYTGKNILYKYNESLYSEEKIEKILDILFTYDNDYITIILHYFYIPFGLTLKERNDFNIDDEKQVEYLKENIIYKMIYSARNISNIRKD